MKNIHNGEEHKLVETELEIKKMEWERQSKGLYLLTRRKNKDEDYKVIEKYPIYFNGEGFLPSLDIQLQYLSLSGKLKSILKGDYEITDFAVNPSKDEIAITLRPETYDVYDSRIGLLTSSDKGIRYLDKEVGGYESPIYTEKGDLFFVHNKHKKSIFESPKIVLWQDGKMVEVMKDSDLSLKNSVNSDSRMGKTKPLRAHGPHIYFIATVRGKAGIYRTGKEGKVETFVKSDFSVDSFDFQGDSIYFIGQNSYQPQEIFKFNGKVSRLTSINKAIENKIGTKPLNFKIDSSDGSEIEGWFIKGKKKGTVLEIHGGPRTSYGEAFEFEFHLLNSLGFNVLFSNPRGSDGYGDDFALTIKGKYGERDYSDIMEFLNHSQNKFGIKRENTGVIGGSYGGFMVNWIVGHTDTFKAAVTDRSISDQISFYFSSDIGPRFNSDQIGGTPYEDLEHFWDKSPIKYIRDIKTPLLIVHSEEDFRCPIWQAYELFTQLRKQGSEVRMISFKGENHLY